MLWNDMTALLTCREVSLITGLSRTTLWRYRGKGWFPEPRRLRNGELRWLVGDVAKWIDALPAGILKHERWERLAALRRHVAGRGSNPEGPGQTLPGRGTPKGRGPDLEERP